MFSNSAFRICVVGLILGGAIWAGSIFLSRAATHHLANGQEEWISDSIVMKPQLYALHSGMQAVVHGDTLSIYNKRKKLVGRNIGIVRKPDENTSCPSKGFTSLAGKGTYFTVEQQACSGWYFVNEYITFRYNPKDSGVWLHKFGLRYTDRRNPDTLLPEKILTVKEFGRLRLNKVVLDSLYKLVK
jgi:hypothetical protein